MLVFVTYPLIFGVSFWAFQTGIMPGKKHPILVLGWFVLTIGLIVALGLTGCRDPGIFYRHARPPPQVRKSQNLQLRGESIETVSDNALCVFSFCLASTGCVFAHLRSIRLAVCRMRIIGDGTTKHKRGVHAMLTLIQIQQLSWKSLITRALGQG